MSRRVNKKQLKKRSKIPRSITWNGVFSGSQQGYLMTSYSSNFTGALPLCCIATGDGYTQRGADDRPLLMSGKGSFLVNQTDNRFATYRIIGITMTSPFTVVNSSGIFYMPTLNIMENSWVSTNLFTNPTAIPGDMNVVSYDVWLDKTFTVDTLNGHNSRLDLHTFKIPQVVCQFTTNDTAGVKSIVGMQYLLFITDAPTSDVNYAYDLWFVRRFKVTR
jgi:hypothetical protein